SIVYSGSPFCTNGSVGSVALTGTSGGTYSSSAGLTINATTGDITPSTSTPGTYTVTYTIPASNGCGAVTATASVTVNAAPTASISYNGPYCSSLQIDQNPVIIGANGGTFQSTPSGLVLNSTTGSISPGSSSPGTYSVVYTVPALNGCSSITANTSVVINGLPTVSFTGLLNSYCEGATTTTLVGNPTGGTFSGLGIVGNDFNPSLATVGNVNITYTFTDANGCSNTAIQQTLINANPIVSLGSLAPMCVNDSPIILSGGSPIGVGGVYSGNGVSGNSFDPALAGVGNHAITYSYTDLNGCTGTSIQTIDVNGLPVVQLQGLDNVYCLNAAPDSVFGFPNGPGGAFFGLGVINGAFDPSVAGVGPHSVIYTYTDANGCRNTATLSTTVVGLTTVSFTGLNGPYCTSSPIVSLTGNPANGTFSGPGVSGVNFDPLFAGQGTHTVVYSITDGNGCFNSDSQTVVVNASPIAQIQGLNPSYCLDAVPVSLTGSPSGGTFSGPGIVGNTFDPSIAGSGQFTITYTVVGSGSCSSTVTQLVQVNALPSVSLVGVSTNYCVSQVLPVSLIGNPVGGSFSGPGVTGSDFTPSVAGIGNHTLIYQVTDANGCSNQSSFQTTVNPNPVVTINGLQASVCENSPVISLNGSPVGGSFSGNGVLGTTFDPSQTVAGQQTVTYTFTDNFGCTGVANQVVQVNALPVVSISGLSGSYCTSSPADVLTLSPVGGTLSGTGVTGNTFDPSIAVVGTNSISYVFTDANGCTNSDIQTTLVSPVPAISITTQSGSSSICAGTELLLNASSGFVSYAWSDGTTSIGTNQGILINQAGTFEVIGTTASGCTSLPASITISVSSTPTFSLGNDTSICAQGTLVLDAGSGFANYLWNTGANTSSITANGPGTYSVIVTDQNGCQGSDVIVVTQSNSVNVTLVPDGPTDFCQGGSVNLSTTQGFDSYLWSNGQITSSINVTQSGIYSVTVMTAQGCLGNSANITVSVIPGPTPSITANGASNLCNGESVVLTASSGFANYTWNNSLSGQSITVNQPGSYTVTVTGSNGCTGTSVPFNVQVNPPLNPVITASGPTDFCFGESVTLTVSIQGNLNLAFWNVNQNPTSSQITVFESGQYFCIVMDDNGCIDSSLIDFPTQVTVFHPQPQISFQNNLLIATGGFSSYQWFMNTGTGNVAIAGATFSTYDAPFSGTYFVEVVDENGCVGRSNPVEFTHVGIDGPEGIEIGLEVLPNPTEGVFEVTANLVKPSKVKIEIFDMLGKLIIQPKDELVVGELNRSYNLNHLGNGVYMIRVNVDDKTYVRRLVKN
ncbi:MAG: T9SS type A sorting domain-containing protein, partial [Bacteroidia bacterium]|nr:T9SS type A sorting domain-containing protein [Bacteroidia bacterium]